MAIAGDGCFLVTRRLGGDDRCGLEGRDVRNWDLRFFLRKGWIYCFVFLTAKPGFHDEWMVGRRGMQTGSVQLSWAGMGIRDRIGIVIV